MRKHDVRKWLHAILDLLPVILIPVFMIYSHRHTINDGSIQVQEKVAVDFNQYVQQIDEYVSSGITFTSNEYFQADGTSTGSIFFNLSTIPLNFGHKYQIKYNSSGHTDLNNYIYFNYNDSNNTPKYLSDYLGQNFQFTCDLTQNGYFRWRIVEGVTLNQQRAYVNIFDLTQMFGSGNEPTIEVFNQLFNQSYYEYTLSHKELVDGDLVTYDDTDIMSQFTYQLYNSVDKYFNMGNVFHLNEVYDWFNLNIFNGQAPIYIFIVYQIVLYELIMDLLMLLYALFMWFIDMIEKLMEKPINSVK